MSPLWAIIFVFVGCCSNVVFLELLAREKPGCGNIVTFAQFFLIFLEGLIFTSKFGTVKPVIPIKVYIKIVSLFGVVQIVNNLALKYDIPMPLHMIFRAGSLLANMILGVLIMGKSYKIGKYLSVLLITVGIVLCTIMSASNIHETKSGDVFTMGIGICLLIFALAMSALMGLYQEKIYKTHGKHPREALFFNHALPLPLFLFFYNDIVYHFKEFSESAPITLPGVNYGVPCLLLFLLGNAVTQYICINNVFVLTTECSSLTVTLVVTLLYFNFIIIMSNLDRKTAEAIEHVNQAEKCLKTGLLKWKPDHEGASSEYEKAGL
ncbi:DgyrCDS6567 [Dimorphilus gyrociliatus]|uniref:DgyrCDS6567 n=1 Tax=Dimorphilus gyrociliatus TaxID=2664684 RepID=A0A7I8VNF9_9ANNE|nr:DgyrCDS6567 [Dimorphilus gyrociliatus]